MNAACDVIGVAVTLRFGKPRGGHTRAVGSPGTGTRVDRRIGFMLSEALFTPGRIGKTTDRSLRAP
jgi:hypothetical protein